MNKDLDQFWDDYYNNREKLKGYIEEWSLTPEHLGKGIEIIKPKYKKKQKASVFIKPNENSLF